MPELSGPIVGLNKYMKTMTGAVLIPDEPDSDGDVVSREKIEEVSHQFMLKYQNIDYQHGLNNVANVVESYILPYPMTVKAYGKEVELPAGSWMMSVKVQDDDTWQQVLEGRLTGFSIMGVPKTALKSKEENIEVFKNKNQRTTLKDLGDFVVTHVSIVDEPAVPKAKFFAIKSKELEDKGLFKRFVEFMKDEQAKKSKGEDIEMTKEELQAFIVSVVKGLKNEEVTEEETVEETNSQEEEVETTEEEQEETATEETSEETSTEEETTTSEETTEEDSEEEEEEETTTEETKVVGKGKNTELTEESIKNLIKSTIMEMGSEVVNSSVGGTSKKSAKSNALDEEAEQIETAEQVDIYTYLGRDRNGVKK